MVIVRPIKVIFSYYGCFVYIGFLKIYTYNHIRYYIVRMSKGLSNLVSHTQIDRDTCLYKIHDNLQILSTLMKRIRIITTDSLDELVVNASCDINSKECMWRMSRVQEQD